MGRLLVFTENYWPGVAGASYLVDLTNGVARLFDSITVASNPEALNEVDLRRMSHPVTPRHLKVVTSMRVWHVLHQSSFTLSVLLGRTAQVLDPLLLAYNIALCRRLIRRERPAMVMSFNGGYPAARSPLAMTIAACREGVPVALAVVSMPAQRRRALAWYERWVDRRVGSAADAIVVNAPQIGDALSTIRSLPAAKMRVVHNALPDNPARASSGTTGEIRIGCVTRMDAMKGIARLIEAFADVAPGHPDARLVLAGDGPELPKLRDYASMLDVSDRIEFLGYIEDDVAATVASYDIYAYPSLWEGLPYAILEAMRAGCAIVATDVGGMAEAVINGCTGLLVPADSTEALADALERLLSDPSMRTRLASAARERFEQQFSIDVMYERAAAVFTDLLSADATRAND